MTTALGVWRYLLRNGQFINAQTQLAQKHLFRYVTKDGTVIFALLSSAAERLLLQLIKETESLAPALESAQSPRHRPTSRTASRNPDSVQDDVLGVPDRHGQRPGQRRSSVH